MKLRGPYIVAFLLLASATVFAIGVGVERSKTHAEATAHTETSGEGSAAHESQEGSPTSTTSEAAAPSESETLLGVNIESWGVVAAVVALSLALAALVVTTRSVPLLGIVVVFALGATVLDVREVLHQIDESRTGVALLAGLATVLHGLLALASLELLVRLNRGRHRAKPSAQA